MYDLFLGKLPNLFETGSLPFKLSDKGDVFSANLERSEYLDFGNSWGIDRENLLDPDSVDILTDGNGLIKGCFPMSLDDKPFELLDTFLVSFFDDLVYLHFHTGRDFWSLILDGIFLDGFNECCVHNDCK